MTTPPTTTERRDDEARNPSTHDTGEHPVTRGEMRRSFRVNEIWTFLVACGVAMAAVMGVYRLAISEAAAAGREAAEPVIQRVAVLEQQRLTDRAEQSARLDRIERNQAEDRELALGSAKKLDAMLRAQGVPNPAPTPAPKDGGP